MQSYFFTLQNHIEGYHELSSKTQIYFSTAAAKWDADFYIKVDDDVHINLGWCISIINCLSSKKGAILGAFNSFFQYFTGMVGSTLARHRSKPRVYIGCMKSGPVLSQK